MSIATVDQTLEAKLESIELEERKRTRRIMRVFGIAAVFVFSVAVVIPILFMITTSFKDPIEIRASGSLIPAQTTILNWIRAYSTEPLFKFLGNSTLVAVVSTILDLLIAVPTTYAIVRFKIGGNILPAMILGGYVMPPIVVAVPFFYMIRMLGLPNTTTGVIIAHTIFNASVAIWLLDSYVRAIPPELEEAAWVDGYSRWDTLRKVVLPLITPGLVATGIICLILSWNEFLFALILTYSEKAMTFPVGISRYQGEHGLQFGEMSAAALTGIVPIYLLVMIFQRYVVSGLTRGGVKG